MYLFLCNIQRRQNLSLNIKNVWYSLTEGSTRVPGNSWSSELWHISCELAWW